MKGKIIKLLSGVYTVDTADGFYECRAKGSFRKKGITPVAGDEVEILAMPDHTGRIEKIEQRKNYLIRPNVSNVDVICYVSSYQKPVPAPFTIDKMLVIAHSQGITPILVFNKSDLSEDDECRALADRYRSLGYSVFDTSAASGAGVASLREALAGKTVVFAGNTGVGKSSIMNALYPQLELETGEISLKLGRGRHTTRHIELYPQDGGLIADTPGFGALELEGYDISRNELPRYFPEFLPFLEQCPYLDCAHMNERDCAVKNAVEEGKIHNSRYESYRQIYQFLKEEETPWQKKINR
ncbi:MAG: ribosome small subunit-dependent GTPase A [Clostridia bacterium]|nr:ribosome small subunit-dependent GTPase A [Clostridia bacterium]